MRATLCGGVPEILIPLKVHEPSSTWSKPVNKLKNVVFPAPLGPMSAVIAPLWISRWPTFTAVKPPNFRRTLSATIIGSGLLTPGVGVIPARAAKAISRRELL